MSNNTTDSATAPASAEDIRAILGALNESDLLEILHLQPTIRDLEEAATWLSGDRDIFSAGDPLSGVVAEIVDVLTLDDEDEAQRAG
ncbi:MAG: hypothetical protein KGL35_29800 [Bradyrhizobium sp.]|uniref:hypothetical protein n=1 Tax=Bradyrhizobium sp. TaxID=376 RepID=UPI001C283202|nr:hypothetical protein [Bradyrhizobium sp.]MBU6461363.1 hypothetical protein [Pseudomonadota bacterium]MDE2066539.1 hypothetical protein [Bradyrhizobium sp.]MDE2472802.1 hypothetical protein [Bradyrhizobium sp.]